MRIMPRVPAPFTYRTPGNVDADTHARDCAQALETAILEEGPDSVLAFIVEPVGGLATGALVAPDHYYKAVRDICTRHGVLLIFDEVMSGAGRTGRFLAAEHWPEARPDMVTLAKGVAAGYTPLGMVLASREMVQTVVDAGGFMHGHTYSANPLSCAVGDAVLAEVMEHDLIGNADRMGKLLGERLNALAEHSGIVGDVRGRFRGAGCRRPDDRARQPPFPGAVAQSVADRTAGHADLDRRRRYRPFQALQRHVRPNMQGDECIRRVSSILAEEAKAVDARAFRFGGEEFVVVLVGREPEQTYAIADRMRLAISAAGLPHTPTSGSDHVTCSFGYAIDMLVPDTDVTALLTEADFALYAAKKAGRNCVMPEPQDLAEISFDDLDDILREAV